MSNNNEWEGVDKIVATRDKARHDAAVLFDFIKLMGKFGIRKHMPLVFMASWLTRHGSANK